MKISRIVLSLTGSLMLLSPVPVAGQNAQGRGERSFLVNGGEYHRIGLQWRHSDHLDFGASVGLRIDKTDDETRSDVSVEVQLKRYRNPTARFSPYFFLAAGPAWRRVSRSSPNVRQTSWGAHVLPGFGLEWFAVDRVSIGGHAGVDIGWWRHERDGSEDQETWTLQTAMSGIRVAFYF